MRRSGEIQAWQPDSHGKNHEDFFKAVSSHERQEGHWEKPTQKDLSSYKLCLSSLIAFNDEVTGSADGNGVVDTAYLDFSKAFNTV